MESSWPGIGTWASASAAHGPGGAWMPGISVSPGWVPLGHGENSRHSQGPSSLYTVALTCHVPLAQLGWTPQGALTASAT